MVYLVWLLIHPMLPSQAPKYLGLQTQATVVLETVFLLSPRPIYF